MTSPAIVRVPRATYRLQLRPEFPFAAAEERLPYLARLGISDLYLSPIFTATPGSSHGYDVCDYTSVSDELGGRPGFERLCGAAERHGLGLILDFVPNHMGVDARRNGWWRDVLEFGIDSRYANFFDIQWYKGNADGCPRIMLPMLGRQFGRELLEGKLALVFEDGLAVAYAEHRFPVNLAGHVRVLEQITTEPSDRSNARTLAAACAEFRTHGGGFTAEMHRDRAGALKVMLRAIVAGDSAYREKILARIAAVNASPESELAALIDEQSYRLSRWKTGVHEINYRRFFAINTLVGVQMERPEVFAAAHALLAELIHHPAVTGLRIDHIDGLRNPAEYLERLRALTARVRGRPLYIAAEKILGRGEALPKAWPIEGATGYELIPQFADLLVDRGAEAAFTDCYGQLAEAPTNYPREVVARKKYVMRELFSDVIDSLAEDLASIVAEDLVWRDFTAREFAKALVDLVARLPVYRTYATSPGAMSEHDRHVIADACETAIREDPRADPGPINFVRDVVIGTYPGSDASAERVVRVHTWRLSWQQYTGAFMAKAVEDTAFYTYVRFVALNEVGGDPETFGGSVADFHRSIAARMKSHPWSLLTTSTHDTKVSEDVRARLYGLSECFPAWEAAVTEWQSHALGVTTSINGTSAPDARDRYRLLQILLGAWPLRPAEVNDEFRRRLREHVQKSVREAERHTSDLHHNEAYFAACDRVVATVTDGPTSRSLWPRFHALLPLIAELGAINSLIQVVLKSTLPGVPDFYQGCEFWDFSLVDPDNRRAVDFALRETALEEMSHARPADLLASWRDGRIKLWTTQRLLAWRREHAPLFSNGTYEPLATRGRWADHMVAFLRQNGTESMVVVVPRQCAAIAMPPIGGAWADTTVEVAAESVWRDILTGREMRAQASLPVAELFSELPFAVLHAERTGVTGESNSSR